LERNLAKNRREGGREDECEKGKETREEAGSEGRRAYLAVATCHRLNDDDAFLPRLLLFSRVFGVHGCEVLGPSSRGRGNSEEIGRRGARVDNGGRGGGGGGGGRFKPLGRWLEESLGGVGERGYGGGGRGIGYVFLFLGSRNGTGDGVGGWHLVIITVNKQRLEWLWLQRWEGLLFLLGVLGRKRSGGRGEGRKRRSWRRRSSSRGRLLQRHAKGAVDAALHYYGMCLGLCACECGRASSGRCGSPTN